VRGAIDSIRQELRTYHLRYGDLYMGSHYDFTTRLLVAVDVSGSMGSDDLARAVEEWRRLQAAARPTLKELLLADGLKRLSAFRATSR
jgi:predicted metal-dependent peptidase